jgi:hypothetical protein
MTMIDRIRRETAVAVRRRIAGWDYRRAHARIFEAPGPRWFSEADPIWRVHADASMLVGGIRALLLQSLHPRAMAAVSRHSGFRGDPWGRLQRTSAFLATTTYGTITAAERMITAVNRIHFTIAGTTTDGLRTGPMIPSSSPGCTSPRWTASSPPMITSAPPRCGTGTGTPTSSKPARSPAGWECPTHPRRSVSWPTGWPPTERGCG